MIPFNKPYCSGREQSYIQEVCQSTTMSGNGQFTKLCHGFFEKRYGFRKCLLTTSGTDALEMCAMLCELKPGDEVIVPSYTFVSSAIAFLREGAKVVFADSGKDNPNITVENIEPLINERTRVIVVVHYAGVACDMDRIMALAEKHHLLVVEDAAHSIDSFYKGKPLGGIGHLAAFSFHETKNINCGEGGMLVVNDERFIRRSEIIWEKGTNRAEFYRGHIWERYDQALRNHLPKGYCLPELPDYATNNYHMYYILCPSLEAREELMSYLKNNGVQTTFHYLPLHSRKYYEDRHDGRQLPNCDRYADTLVRLPLYYELKDDEIDLIVKLILHKLSSGS